MNAESELLNYWGQRITGITGVRVDLNFASMHHLLSVSITSAHRLRPIVLIPLCLIFGVTSAAPEFSIQRGLTYAGLSPAGIHDLVWPH
jgi:hypothetical protein